MTQPGTYSHWIDAAARMQLGFLPTPLVALDRLSERLGGPRVWMKRDDCTGLATGGNKTRKLEYLLAAARAEDCDTVITYGAVQSNHARQTAAACAAAGIECHLILARKVPWQHPTYDHSGNVQLDRLLGANLHLLEPAEAANRGRALREELLAAGRKPYVIPVGGSNAIGALGYVRCARELLEQCEALDMDLTDIIHASSSAGTQGGLVAGLIHESTVTVQGINVSEPEPEALRTAVHDIAAQVLEDHQPGAAPPEGNIHVDHRFFGDGYGLPTKATLEAIQLVGASEGILLDPVYSGKAFGGLIAKIRGGEFDQASNVVFIHTGGCASLPVYDNVL
ncbi:MAG: D-cysteine desulfhydrase family protein [Gammaproteobacteria bacterium]|nr:D-cysteine desulfhydrase family protein [Gammaproteobacteria bacterium]